MVRRSSVRHVALRVVLALAVLPAVACARYQRYESAPLDPERQAAVYAERRLDDPELAHFLAEHGAPSPDSGLSPTALAFVALYFRTDLAEARASLRASRAGEITAGTRPFPSATATMERASSPGGGNSSPWTVSLTTGLTFETGGKRAARLARARAFTLASGLRLDATAWRLAQDARQAAVTSLGTDRDLADAEAEVAALRTVLELLRARYAEGRVSLADIAQAETDVQTAVVARVQTRRARTDARVALARSLGVPLRHVERVPLREEPRSACDLSDSIGVDSAAARLASIALRQRYEVGATLADYAVADANLRLQVAQQYPDLTIGPGIVWDQGITRWLLSVGSSAIPLNRNRGPIAEAEARRAVQAVRVALVEDTVLAQVDSGVAGCRDVGGAIAATDSLVATTAERLRLTGAAYARGEIGQTELAFARLALVRVTRTRRQALRRRQTAGVALEAALGRWLTAPGIRWPELREPSGSEEAPGGSRKEKRE